MSSSDEAEILYYIWRKKIKKKRKNLWVRPIFLDREKLGEFHLLQPQLVNDDEMFYSYYRMSKLSYELLVSKLKPLFKGGHTHFRTSISFEERLAVTIRYLANGENFHSASFRFRISHNHIGFIIANMLPLIYVALGHEYLKFPSKEDFSKIGEEFRAKKYFPNCLGAIDGKHVRIHKPAHGGSLFFNYKHYHSIILLAIVNANYVFTMIDVGSYGKNSDGGVFNASQFGQMFNNDEIDFPEDKSIDASDTLLPYVFIGDEAFRLSNHLLKPYPRKELNTIKRRYNYRLSYARQMVECTFGILVSKFRIFESPIAIYPEKVDNVIKAACVLHNFIRIEDRTPVEFENISAGAFTNLTDSTDFTGRAVNQSRREARSVRDKFAEYFSGLGSVDWQDDIILSRDEINNEENI